jgi:hypothetical protein
VRSRSFGALAVLAACAFAGSVRADGETLPQAADRVGEEWRKEGALVERGEARFFVDANATITVALPEPETSPQRCTTVAILGARGMTFHAKVVGVDDDPLDDDGSKRAASVAGVLEMSGCGDAAPLLERLRVTNDAGRGAIETVVARSARPLSPLRSALPERTGGALPPPPDAGATPILPIPGKRADFAEARATRDGAQVGPRAAWTAASDGSGEVKVDLEAGCHRIEIFATDPRGARNGPHRRRLDVDAEVRSDEDEELLARDRTDDADARLELCVGKETATSVIFAGAPAGSDVTVTHARWRIPAHVPDLWGPEARARMARALLARHAPSPPADPVALYEGPYGLTPIPISIEPGACYLAVAAVTLGRARGLGLRAQVGASEARDERTSDDDAGLVAFCAHDQGRARIEVETRGTSGSAWGLALFRVVGRAWEGR